MSVLVTDHGFGQDDWTGEVYPFEIFWSGQDLPEEGLAVEFPNDRDIVLYCACPNEESARRAAQILLSRGFKRARPLAGGLDAWIASGRAVNRPAQTVVIERPSKVAA